MDWCKKDYRTVSCCFQPQEGEEMEGVDHDVSRMDIDLPVRTLSVAGSLSVVQFTCAIYYVQEDVDLAMVIDVVRLGSNLEQASVHYRTVDGSAKSGVKYEYCEGDLVFEEGDTYKQIEIPIIGNDSWDAVLEFTVVLENPSNTTLGKYLHSCRVVVIDDDFFPSNKYAKEFKEERIESIPPLGLFVEFIKLLWGNSKIKAKIIKHMFYAILNGFGYFMSMYLQVYLIDVVLAETAEEGEPAEGELEKAEKRLLGEEEGEHLEFVTHRLLFPGSRRRTAYVVAGLYLVPYLLRHLSDLRLCYIGLKGTARSLVQANLLRKYLYYDEVRRMQIKAEHVGMVMMRDVFEVVDIGVMKVFVLFGIFCKLAFALIFILAENKLAALPLIACGFILPLFLTCRERVSIEAVEEKAYQEVKLLRCVNFATGSYRLIADFFMRPQVIDSYEKRIEMFKEKEEEQESVFINNMAIAPWLTGIIVGGYMIYGSVHVSTVGGDLRLGIFLATINIFKEIGTEIKEIYKECNEIQKSYGPLIKVATYMNYETDLQSRRRVNRQRRELGIEEHKRLRSSHLGLVDFPVDLVRIRLHNVTFKFNEKHTVFTNVCAAFEQGQLHAIVGDAHKGKATLLKLIGQVFMPSMERGDDGYVFVPPHLRILHMSQDVHLLHDSFMKNLILTMPDVNRVGGLGRVKKILERVELNSLAERLHDDMDMEEYATELSHTHFPKLALARAMIMNPEVLIMHKPMNGFNHHQAEHIAQILREHVDGKGLFMPEEEKHLRRPRTVFFSCQIEGTNLPMADTVHEIYEKGLREIQKTRQPMAEE